MASLMIIDQNVKDKIAKIIDFASKNARDLTGYTQETVKELQPVGDSPEYSVNIPIGLKAVYSEEIQKPGRLRHVSVSVDLPNRVPATEAVEMIMHEFGFKKSLKNADAVWEESVNGGLRAINVIEII